MFERYPELYLLGAAMLTSVAAYALLASISRLSLGSLQLALRRTLECAGVSLVFLVTNMLIEVALVLLVRQLTGRFVTVYLAGDVMIVPISCLQGVAVWWWKAVAR